MRNVHSLLRNAFVIGLLLLCGAFSLSATQSYCFRVYLNDKGAAGFRADQPQAFLSEEAVQRRTMRGIEVTPSDFPVSRNYIDSLLSFGGEKVVESKWQNTVVIEYPDSMMVIPLHQLPFVDSVKCVWKGSGRKAKTACPVDTGRLITRETPLSKAYGYAESQIKMLNGIELHRAGYRGKGLRIAVIDAGYMNVNRMAAFDSMKVIGTHNFVNPENDVYCEDEHGTKVLSCMAANLPDVMVGTAPEASYLLLKSEDPRSEFPIEEDYWAAAVEYADSIGVDIITSSLGYFTFDDENETKYTRDDLNGRTAFISRAADAAADRGHILFCSAGNEGGGVWEKITFPSDASDIITVGSVTDDRIKSEFSSIGFTSDYRVKPDVVALGTFVCVLDYTGNIRYSSGTSFSTPILAGLGACLVQALPGLTNRQLITLLQESSHLNKQPDAELGYGIPDVYKAYKKERKHAYRNSR